MVDEERQGGEGHERGGGVRKKSVILFFLFLFFGPGASFPWVEMRIACRYSDFYFWERPGGGRGSCRGPPADCEIVADGERDRTLHNIAMIR